MASVSFDETCRALGIPDEIKRSFENKGLKSLYSWQVECLNNTGALTGNNVVYSAPTGGGKTLVAELVMLKTACALRKKCIFVLPYVSLVVEKHQDIQRLLNIYNRSKPKSERVQVKSFHGESKFNRKLQEDILICTIEKANTVVNSLISSGQIFQLGCVIIDEMHVIGDACRGYNLEILVSKLKYLQMKAATVSKKLHIQVVALSATISNLPAIASWFNAVLYQTSFRPVPLKEMIVSGNSLFDSVSVEEIRPLLSLQSIDRAISNQIQFKKQISTLSEEMRQILCLCIEGLRNGQQVIVFCTSRNHCQTTAKLLSDLLSNINMGALSSGDNDVNDVDTEAEILLEGRMRLSEKIHAESSGFKVSLSSVSGSTSTSTMTDSPQNMLKKCILSGIAFHHAGLSAAEREVVEKGFRKGILNIITATSTLAAGVNLPAGRVIIRSMYFGRELISTVQYRQMCGRAGRAGLVKFGESFVLTRNNAFERDKARLLATAPIPKIESQMNPWKDGGKALLKVLLELFALGVCVDANEIQLYTEQTLLFSEIQATETVATVTSSEGISTHSRDDLRLQVQELLTFLSLAKAVEPERHDNKSNNDATINTCVNSSRIRVTRFGRAVMESNMNLDEALVIYEDLLQARTCGIVLESNLHLLYLVTPLSHALVPNFFQLCQVHDNARKNKKEDILSLFESIGIGPREEATMQRWTQQPPSYDALHNAENNLRRFKIERESGKDDNSGKAMKSKGSISEFDCQLICKCKRLWAASALNMLVECQSLAQVVRAYSSESKQLTIADVDSLALSTTVLCCRLVKFCREIGWPDFERLIEHVNSDLLSDGLTKEHVELLSIPGMHPTLAKTLVSSGISSIHELAMAHADVIVQKIQLNVRFEVADVVLFEQNLDRLDQVKAMGREEVAGVTNEPGSVSSADSSTGSVGAGAGAGAGAVISKDESRRLHLSGFVHSLITSARNKFEADEAFAADQASNSLESISSDDDDEGNADSKSECSDDSEKGQGVRNKDGECSTDCSSQEDNELESSMEEERCGFMYEQRNWLQQESQHDHSPDPCKTLSHGLRNNEGTGGGSGNINNGGSDLTSLLSASPHAEMTSLPCIPPELAAVSLPCLYETSNEPRYISPALKNTRPESLTGGDKIGEDDITDDAFMMLFDTMESYGATNAKDQKSKSSPHAPVTAPTDITKRPLTQDSSQVSSLSQTSSVNSTGPSTTGIIPASTSMTPGAAMLSSTTTPTTAQQSPYLFPFTPSKRPSPGRYLYLPQTDDNLQPNSAQDAINKHASATQQKKDAFLWLQLNDNNGCDEFLSNLRGCHCISFELLYTSIPIYAKTRSANHAGDEVPVSTILKAWAPLVAWRPSSCLLPANVSNGSATHKDPSDARVLTGIGFSFGGETGYFLPLPTIPPLLTLPMSSTIKNFALCSSHIDQFPENIQISICRYVGFDAIFGKCPRLRECLRRNMIHNSASKKNKHPEKLCSGSQGVSSSHDYQYPPQGNSLLAVSKLWATRARQALRVDWLAGKCIEWRLCNEIMTSERITKVAVDIKGKIFSLRERDVLMRGYLEDPQLSFIFQGNDHDHQQETEASGVPSQFMLPVPPVVRLPRGVAPTPFIISVVKTCHVAVATMRIMAVQESELKKANLFEAFINIEMPLCITVADAERNGLPTHSEFVTQLRQDLHDRNKMIEYFCQSYQTVPHVQSETINFNFDPSSLKDVHRVKHCISQLLNVKVWDAFDRWKVCEDSHVGSSGSIPLKSNRSQWSTGKEINTSNSSGSRNISPEQQEAVSRMVENILASHPLLLLVKEFRSHVRLMPLLQSILSSRFRPYGGDQYGRLCHQELDRVRGIFNTLGTDTGRLIVTTPPLQQIPHQCSFTKTERVHLLAELSEARSHGAKSYQQFLFKINRCSPKMRDWVRMTSLAAALGDDASNVGTSKLETFSGNSNNSIYSSVGGTVGGVAKYSSGKLVCVLDRNITQPIQCGTSKMILNLFEIWQKAGFAYTKEAALQIPIVVVDIKNQQYCYPADQVVRLTAPLLPSTTEASVLQHASMILSQGPSSKQSPSHNDPLFDMLCKQLQGIKINSEDYDAYWTRAGGLSTNSLEESSTRQNINPRDGFCASKGYVLMTSDYCQIELRILAHFSLDENLCGAFRDPLSEDIFKCIASRWQGVPVSEITSEERNRVKQLSYALLYGAGPGKVAADAGCSVSQAEIWIGQFLDVYPGIKTFMKEVKGSCAKLGYVQTMLGRRRYLPHIRHAQRKERARAERQAVNSVCQGSAADLIKLAMINIHHALYRHFKTRNYHARRSVPGGGLYVVLDSVRPVLQIHDELVFEVHESYVSEVAEHVKHCMENAVELNVPLKVKISVGRTLGSLETLDLPASDFSQNDHSQSAPRNTEDSLGDDTLAWKQLDVDTTNSHIEREYEIRNRKRRVSGNLQPHPLLAMSESELELHTSKKRSRSDSDSDRIDNNKIGHEHADGRKEEPLLPLARRIFGGD